MHLSGGSRRAREWDPPVSGRETLRWREDSRRGSGWYAALGQARSAGVSPGTSRHLASPSWEEPAPPAPEVMSLAPVLSFGSRRIWYQGVDALIARELQEGLSVSFGDVPPAAALVGTARSLVWVLERFHVALAEVEAGRTTLLELCTEAFQAVNRRDVADRWSVEVYAATREGP